MQEALLAAAAQWPTEGVPGNPRGWLITVASRRLTDMLRAEQARAGREQALARQAPPGQWLAPAADTPAAGGDDTLILLFLCGHPALSPASQIALTLRAVGGLTTAQIARAFLVPEAAMPPSRQSRTAAPASRCRRGPSARAGSLRCCTCCT